MPDDSSSPPSFAEFDFDLARAVLDQLVEAFDQLPIGRLISVNLLKMQKGQGVYQLFMNDQLYYVGKADNLPHRLARHERSLSSRLNLDPSKLGYKALYIHKNWTTWATEDAMIRHFSPANPHLWNTSGFGSNDPGHNREDTAETDSFNAMYPINPDIACPMLETYEGTAWDILSDLKEKLPYLLRFHKVTSKFNRPIDHAAEAQLKDTAITLAQTFTVRDAVVSITKQLGKGWQATQFKGRLIIYKETERYNHGTVICRGGK